MTIQRFRGTEANMLVLRDELKRDPVIGQSLSFDLEQAPREGGSATLAHGVVAELAITVASTVLASGAYEIIRAAVSRAMSRGPVEDLSEPDPEDGDDSAGTPTT